MSEEFPRFFYRPAAADHFEFPLTIEKSRQAFSKECVIVH
jgi:hypothetical protein